MELKKYSKIIKKIITITEPEAKSTELKFQRGQEIRVMVVEVMVEKH